MVRASLSQNDEGAVVITVTRDGVLVRAFSIQEASEAAADRTLDESVRNVLIGVLTGNPQ